MADTTIDDEVAASALYLVLILTPEDRLAGLAITAAPVALTCTIRTEIPASDGFIAMPLIRCGLSRQELAAVKQVTRDRVLLSATNYDPIPPGARVHQLTLAEDTLLSTILRRIGFLDRFPELPQ